MTAYYNEIDTFAAEWLRELIKAGHIAPGEVDTRSIADVSPDDLSGFIQCHFFAGIGVWSHALRQAGWADDRPVWTGSCPCQSFSAAGKGAGFDDPRHLWPHFYRLIAECKPDTVFGEQVEAAIRHGWLDLVQADLEREGYAVGSVVFPAAGIGAPHIRSRLYWVADSMCDGAKHGPRCCVGEEAKIDRGDGGVQGERLRIGVEGSPGGLAYSICNEEHQEQRRPTSNERERGANVIGGCGVVDSSKTPRPTNGQWRNADWLFCRDGKWRPVEPGTFPLATGAPARVGRLRGYGNAICAPQAQAFIEAYLTIK